jgi:ATP-dependent 26S proteasome regulatory subunit
MGQTSAHLQKAFQLVTCGGGALLFLDEFDALACVRVDSKEGAGREQNAITSSILQMLDSRPQGIVMAATNRLDMLDAAILRRFDVTIKVPGPSTEAADKFCDAVFERHNMKRNGFAPPDVSSFAAVERNAVGYIRKALLES